MEPDAADTRRSVTKARPRTEYLGAAMSAVTPSSTLRARLGSLEPSLSFTAHAYGQNDGKHNISQIIVGPASGPEAASRWHSQDHGSRQRRLKIAKRHRSFLNVVIS